MTRVPCAICLLMWLCMGVVEGACDAYLMSVCERGGVLCIDVVHCFGVFLVW